MAKRKLTLRNGRIDGALFSATKVFENGSMQPIEGAFMNRTSYESPSDRGHTEFGLGIQGNMVVMGPYGVDQFFFIRR